jgi:hypothetical protein
MAKLWASSTVAKAGEERLARRAKVQARRREGKRMSGKL